MDYSVGQVAAFAGVTVRTLHHYDRTGLLSPGGRSRSGHRRYDDADLARLRQILFHRRLGFPLDEIAELLSGPPKDALDRLRRRRRQLHEEIDRLRRLAEMADRAIEVQQTGVPLTDEERSEILGGITFDLSYATEAGLRWQDSPTHDEAMARAAAHTKEDWRRLMAEAAAWRARLLAAFDAGEPAGGARAMDLAEEHRGHVSRWFTPCPPGTHRRLADEFTEDPRAFALVVPPARQRPGLDGYLRDAVHANADRQERAGTGAGEEQPGNGTGEGLPGHGAGPARPATGAGREPGAGEVR